MAGAVGTKCFWGDSMLCCAPSSPKHFGSVGILDSMQIVRQSGSKLVRDLHRYCTAWGSCRCRFDVKFVYVGVELTIVDHRC